MKKIKNIYKKITILILALALAVAYTKVTAFADDNSSSIEHNQMFSDSSINDGLGIAKNFGIFTNSYSINHIESSIASRVGRGGQYNFTSNNFNVNNNKITVTKTYTDSQNNPIERNVKLRLYRIQDNDEVRVDEKSGYTTNGKLEVEFDKLIAGTYEVREVIENNNNQEQELTGGETVVTQSGDMINTSSSGRVTIEDEKFNNVSQFGKIEVDSLGKPLTNSYVVLEDESDYAKFKDAKTDEPNVKIIKAGTNGFEKINWDKEFANFNNLSKNLAHATDSSDVKVYNLTASDLTRNEGWNFQDEGKKWLVINVEVPTNTSWVTMMTSGYKRNNVDLDAVFYNSDQYKDLIEKQTSIIWNFYTVNNGEASPYTGTVENQRIISGTMLLPSGTMKLSGLYGGNIISNRFENGNEIHYKNQ